MVVFACIKLLLDERCQFLIVVLTVLSITWTLTFSIWPIEFSLEPEQLVCTRQSGRRNILGLFFSRFSLTCLWQLIIVFSFTLVLRFLGICATGLLFVARLWMPLFLDDTWIPSCHLTLVDEVAGSKMALLCILLLLSLIWGHNWVFEAHCWPGGYICSFISWRLNLAHLLPLYRRITDCGVLFHQGAYKLRVFRSLLRLACFGSWAQEALSCGVGLSCETSWKLRLIYHSYHWTSKRISSSIHCRLCIEILNKAGKIQPCLIILKVLFIQWSQILWESQL